MAKLCPKCGEEINTNGFCETCQMSFHIYEKIKIISKQLYNQGLHLSKVRDLSGAINVLQRSVRFDKNNIDARNLLGLVYFEIGETVLALQQWVVSKNLKPTDNLAGKYLKIIQENQTHLDKLNSAIKKYNQALAHIIQSSEDLAVIQLRKVISLNPKFIKAYALLALCYIKENQNQKAQKILLKILSIDKNNYIARKYYDEIVVEDPNAVEDGQHEADKATKNEEEFNNRRPPIHFNSSFQQVIFVVGGALIGLAVALFLISPTQIKEKNMEITDLSDQVKAQSSELLATTSKLNTMTQNNEELEKKTVTLTTDLEKAVEIQSESAKILLALQYHAAKDYLNAADELYFIDATKLEGTELLQIYNTLKTEVYAIVSLNAYNSGTNYYFNKSYDKAIEQLDLSIKMLTNENFGDKAYYYRGVAHYYLEQFDDARKDLEYVISTFPDSGRLIDAQWYLTKF